MANIKTIYGIQTKVINGIKYKLKKMRNMPNIGDWGFITGSDRVADSKWKSSFPNDYFGKVIEIKVRYSSLTGTKFPPVIVMRCYRKGDKPHMNTNKKYFKPLITT